MYFNVNISYFQFIWPEIIFFFYFQESQIYVKYLRYVHDFVGVNHLQNRERYRQYFKMYLI